MKNVKMPVGNVSFKDIRTNNCFYIDKTLLIENIIRNDGIKAFLFTRPRRFGKTLNMSMLSSFFDISKDSRKLFEGLKIAENKELCDGHMNRYPTIFISFKNTEGLSFDSAFDFVKGIFFNLYIDYLYLLDSDKIEDSLKDKFRTIYKGNPTVTDIKNSLSLLINMLHAYYGKKVILLIDEYDVPINKANINGYYREMLDLMRGILQVLKDNDKLQFAVITGCLRIAKESIFTGLNNLYVNSIADKSYNEFFGFTEDEVKEAFDFLEIPEKLSIVKEWYDGYHIGRYDIYCPWDVVNYLNDLNMDATSEPKNYWANTSGNQIIESFVRSGSRRMLSDMNLLLSGNYLVKRINDNITYDYLYSSEDNVWSVLLMTGYLTPVSEEELRRPLFDGEYALKIPNKEVMSIFSEALTSWVSYKSEKRDLNELQDAVWDGDAEAMSKEITKVLNDTLSYNDLYHEYVYHLFLAGLFRGLGYSVSSNKEFGMGRPDIVVIDNNYNRVAVFELKCADKAVDDAIKQIDEKKYLDGLTGFDLLIGYGIRFDGKSAEVKLKDKMEK